MNVVYNRIIPVKGFSAINLFGVVFARKEFEPLHKSTIRHEAIHTAQAKEMLFVFFYVWYIIEWLIRLIQYRDKKEAYRSISFEREAYTKMYRVDYLEERRLFAWIKYLKK